MIEEGGARVSLDPREELRDTDLLGKRRPTLFLKVRVRVEVVELSPEREEGLAERVEREGSAVLGANETEVLML